MWLSVRPFSLSHKYFSWLMRNTTSSVGVRLSGLWRRLSSFLPVHLSHESRRRFSFNRKRRRIDQPKPTIVRNRKVFTSKTLLPCLQASLWSSIGFVFETRDLIIWRVDVVYTIPWEASLHQTRRIVFILKKKNVANEIGHTVVVQLSMAI